MPNQISVITGTQDSRAFNSIREQNEDGEVEAEVGKNNELEKEDLRQKIKEYQEKLKEMDSKQAPRPEMNIEVSDAKILQKDEEESKLNLKTDLERLITKNEIPPSSLKEQSPPMKEGSVHQTPERRFADPQNQDANNLPSLPSHITGSMKKIRNSPPLAENERMEYVHKEHEDSPNSIIPNHYNEENTAFRVGQSPKELPNPEVEIQNPLSEEEELEFKPDPDLLMRLNQNMANNDMNVGKVDKEDLTEEQKKKREERERIERERQEQREKLYNLMSNNDNPGFWGGGYYDEEGAQPKSEDHEENISINSVTSKVSSKI